MQFCDVEEHKNLNFLPTSEPLRTVCISLVFNGNVPPNTHLHYNIHLVILSEATHNWGIHEAINLEEASDRQSACNITPSLRHCSNKYKLAREGENQEIEKVFIFIYFFSLWWSQVELKEMSFQLSLENVQGSSGPDGGGKFIPAARKGEWKGSGEWFWASLWWYHEASLTRRSQTSGRDVDCHQWVEVGGCWACGCSICNHQCLELDAICNWEPVQGDKERCNMGSFGIAEDQSCRCILNHL